MVQTRSQTQSTTSSEMSICRTCVLQMITCVGKLCHISTMSSRAEMIKYIVKVLHLILETASSLGLDLLQSIHGKMELNDMKYPAKLCKGSVDKYTKYTYQTGITKNNQSFYLNPTVSIPISCEQMAEAIPCLTEITARFARARDWTKFDTERNLTLAIVAEIGELASLIIWIDDELTVDQLSSEQVGKISQELADISIYVLRLALKYGITIEVCKSLRD